LRQEVETRYILSNKYRGRVKYMLNLDELEGYVPVSQSFLRPYAEYSPQVGLLALQRLQRPLLLKDRPQTIGEHLQPHKFLSEASLKYLLRGGNTKTTIDLFQTYRRGRGWVKPFDSSTWAWSYLGVSYKVFIERLFRGDLDIVEGLLFVHFKPAFTPRGGRSLGFLKFFLAEYAQSEALMASLGKALETPLGVVTPDSEDADRAETRRSFGGRKRRFLSNPYFFNKTFFFFCFF